MALPTNYLVKVATYVDAGLGALDNMNSLIPTLNTTLLNFQNRTAQLGDEVIIKLPVRYRAANGLVVKFQPTDQREHRLKVEQAKHVGFAFTEQEFLFNAKQFMDDYGMSATRVISDTIESNVFLNAVSKVPHMTIDQNGDSIPTGTYKTENGPFRFYGNGLVDINTTTQLAEADAFFHEYGAAPGRTKVYVPNMAVPAIIGSMQNQFVPGRNEKVANSWELGSFSGMDFYRGNMLPKHTAGVLGDTHATLTVVSISDDGKSLTCSGAGTHSKAARMSDLAQFEKSAGINFVRFADYGDSQSPVQFRILEDADSSGDLVTLSVFPPLLSNTSSTSQNLSAPIVAGMKLKIMPSHKVGLIVGGNAFYLAMPRLSEVINGISSVKVSTKTQVALRHYYSDVPFMNTKGYVVDCIFDSMLHPDYCMRLLFPA